MDIRTCKWCGKRVDSHRAFQASGSTEYCSRRCRIAAENQKKREDVQRKKDWENSWFRRWWRQLSVKWKIIIIGGLLIFGYIWSLINGVQ